MLLEITPKEVDFNNTLISRMTCLSMMLLAVVFVTFCITVDKYLGVINNLLA